MIIRLLSSPSCNSLILATLTTFVLAHSPYDLVIIHTHERPAVVKVASDDRPLNLFSPPQILLPALLQLIEHEKGPACSSELLELREDVGWGAGLDGLVEPYASGDDIDSVQARSARERGDFGEVRGAVHDVLESVVSESKHDPVDVVDGVIISLSRVESVLKQGLLMKKVVMFFNSHLLRATNTIHAAALLLPLQINLRNSAPCDERSEPRSEATS